MAILKQERKAIRDALKQKRGAHKELAERLCIKPASLSLWLRNGFKSQRIGVSIYGELIEVIGRDSAMTIQNEYRRAGGAQ